MKAVLRGGFFVYKALFLSNFIWAMEVVLVDFIRQFLFWAWEWRASAIERLINV
jgi:hypothetical protein